MTNKVQALAVLVLMVALPIVTPSPPPGRYPDARPTPRPLAWTCVYDGFVYPEAAGCRWVAQDVGIRRLEPGGFLNQTLPWPSGHYIRDDATIHPDTGFVAEWRLNAWAIPGYWKNGYETNETLAGVVFPFGRCTVADIVLDRYNKPGGALNWLVTDCGGTSSNVAYVPLGPGFHVFRLEASGATVTYRVDGVIVHTANVGTFVPVYGQRAQFSNGIIGSSRGYAWWDYLEYGT